MKSRVYDNGVWNNGSHLKETVWLKGFFKVQQCKHKIYICFHSKIETWCWNELQCQRKRFVLGILLFNEKKRMKNIKIDGIRKKQNKGRHGQVKKTSVPNIVLLWNKWCKIYYWHSNNHSFFCCSDKSRKRIDTLRQNDGNKDRNRQRFKAVGSW